ncbi:MAG: hypothetical protein H0U57_02665 [Tatlockia sp.]|nr:hypothetical protein [Tatlockia sp.]
MAELIVNNIPAHAAVDRVEIAEPGFINFFINEKVEAQVIAEVLQKGELFGPGKFDKDPLNSTSNLELDNTVQYAHARISSVLRQLKEQGLNWDEEKGLANINLLVEPQEKALIKLVSSYPGVIKATSASNQLAKYLKELATGLHSYYNAVQLLPEQESLRSARLCLSKAIRQVLRNGLQLIGVLTPESM